MHIKDHSIDDDLDIVDDRFAAVCVEVDKLAKIGGEAVTKNLAALDVPAEHATKILAVLAAEDLSALEQLVSPENAGLQLPALLSLPFVTLMATK